MYLSLNYQFQVALINITINNESPFESNVIYLNTISKIYLENCTFCLKNQAFLVAKNSKIILNKVFINKSISLGKKFECLLFSRLSKIFIFDSIFSQITSFGEKNLILARNSAIKIYNSYFSKIQSNSIENFVLVFSNLTFIGNHVFKYLNGWAEIKEGNVFIRNSNFSNEIYEFNNQRSEQVSSTLKCKNCNLSVYNSLFFGNKNEKYDGGVSI